MDIIDSQAYLKSGQIPYVMDFLRYNNASIEDFMNTYSTQTEIVLQNSYVYEDWIIELELFNCKYDGRKKAYYYEILDDDNNKTIYSLDNVVNASEDASDKPKNMSFRLTLYNLQNVINARRPNNQQLSQRYRELKDTYEEYFKRGGIIPHKDVKDGKVEMLEYVVLQNIMEYTDIDTNDKALIRLEPLNKAVIFALPNSKSNQNRNVMEKYYLKSIVIKSI